MIIVVVVTFRSPPRIPIIARRDITAMNIQVLCSSTHVSRRVIHITRNDLSAYNRIVFHTRILSTAVSGFLTDRR